MVQPSQTPSPPHGHGPVGTLYVRGLVSDMVDLPLAYMYIYILYMYIYIYMIDVGSTSPLPPCGVGGG